MSLPKQKLKLAVVQMCSTDQVEVNEAWILSKLNELSSEGLDLVSFPENSTYIRIKSGEMPGFSLDGEFWQKLQAWCGKTGAALHFGSIPLADADGVSNASIWVDKEGAKPVYRKIHLFDVEVDGAKPVRESDDYKHGSEPSMLTFKSWNIALSICYDIRFAELYQKYREQDAHLIMIPAAFLVPTGKAHWEVLLRARAIENQCFVAAAAQAGEHKSGEFSRHTYGHSMAVDPWGQILSEAGDKGAEHFVVELDPKQLEKVRTQIPMAQHRRL